MSRGEPPRVFPPPSSIKVCPICLGEYHAYDRLYWRTRFLVTCPQHSDLLTLKALGIEDTTIDNSLPSSQLEELGSLAPRNYFSLLRSICKVVRVFSADYLLAFLTPEFHTLLAQLQGLLATFHKILLKCNGDSTRISN
jgi:hypothetical protein